MDQAAIETDSHSSTATVGHRGLPGVHRGYYESSKARVATTDMVNFGLVLETLFLYQKVLTQNLKRFFCQPFLEKLFFNFCKTILSFETPSSSDQMPQITPFIFTPNHYVNISDIWKKKITSLKFYKKELRPKPHPRSLENIKISAQRWGTVSGFKAAEAFQIIRKFEK